MIKQESTTSRRIITSVRWTEAEFTRLQLCLAGSGQTNLSDLIREATLAHLNAVLQPYDKTIESNNERKERTKEKKETTKNPLCLAASRTDAEAKASTLPKVEKSLTERRQTFWNRLVPFVRKGIYSLDMVKAFYLYWTECNEHSRKMRFELQKTYELPRRLATWHKRDLEAASKSPASSRSGQPLTPSQLADQLAAKQQREASSEAYQRYQASAQQHAISYAKYRNMTTASNGS